MAELKYAELRKCNGDCERHSLLCCLRAIHLWYNVYIIVTSSTIGDGTDDVTSLLLLYKLCAINRQQRMMQIIKCFANFPYTEVN